MTTMVYFFCLPTVVYHLNNFLKLPIHDTNQYAWPKILKHVFSLLWSSDDEVWARVAILFTGPVRFDFLPGDGYRSCSNRQNMVQIFPDWTETRKLSTWDQYAENCMAVFWIAPPGGRKFSAWHSLLGASEAGTPAGPPNWPLQYIWASMTAISEVLECWRHLVG